MVPVLFIPIPTNTPSPTSSARVLLPGGIAQYPAPAALSDYFLSSTSPLIAVIPCSSDALPTKMPQIACLARMLRIDQDLLKQSDLMYLQGIF